MQVRLSLPCSEPSTGFPSLAEQTPEPLLGGKGPACSAPETTLFSLCSATHLAQARPASLLKRASGHLHFFRGLEHSTLAGSLPPSLSMATRPKI